MLWYHVILRFYESVFYQLLFKIAKYFKNIEDSFRQVEESDKHGRLLKSEPPYFQKYHYILIDSFVLSLPNISINNRQDRT